MQRAISLLNLKHMTNNYSCYHEMEDKTDAEWKQRLQHADLPMLRIPSYSQAKSFDPEWINFPAAQKWPTRRVQRHEIRCRNTFGSFPVHLASDPVYLIPYQKCVACYLKHVRSIYQRLFVSICLLFPSELNLICHGRRTLARKPPTLSSLKAQMLKSLFMRRQSLNACIFYLDHVGQGGKVHFACFLCLPKKVGHH